MIEIDELAIEGRNGKVLFQFANIAIEIDPEDARRIAYALMTQADRAEHGTA